MKISPSAPVWDRGRARRAETYSFYIALTEEIMALVARVMHGDPAQLRFKSMDFSHAFEAMLYFSCIHDPGLVGLHRDPEDVSSAKLLNGSTARLLALNGFARGAALRFVARRERIGKISREVKQKMLRLVNSESCAQGRTAVDEQVLFLARSPRFARYFSPIADRLKGRCAFLIPSGDAALREMLSEWGWPTICYQTAVYPRNAMGKMLADYGSYLAAYAEGLEPLLAQSRARLLVVPEGNSPEDEVANRVAHSLGWNTACLQQGWSPVVHPGFRNLSYSEFMVWGAGFSDLLRPYNPRQNFTAVGNHELIITLPAKRSGVLFLFQGFDNWLGGRQSTEAMLLLAERIADAYAGSPVFIRPHPVAPLPEDVLKRLSRRPNIRVEPPVQTKLADAFAKARVSVSTYSTTILESVAAGTVPIIFNTTTMPRYWPDVDAAGAGLEIRDINHAESAIRRLLTDQVLFESFSAPMKAFAARFFRPGGGAALKEIESVLLRLSGD